ncbi:MAG TPA: hypothetical protein VKT50_12130 [Candidatus Acidoferrales bacterium]|nr:hypothetical protein [Candidatus Acidoferrales bacterium]
MKTVGRVLAALFGGLLVLVQLSNILKLPFPSYAQAVGFDLAWILILVAGVYLLLWGLGVKLTRKKAN